MMHTFPPVPFKVRLRSDVGNYPPFEQGTAYTVLSVLSGDRLNISGFTPVQASHFEVVGSGLTPGYAKTDEREPGASKPSEIKFRLSMDIHVTFEEV